MSKFVNWIWWSDPYVRQFERGLRSDLSALEPAHERLFNEDLDAFHDMLRAAQADRDLKTFISGCEVLRRHNALTRKLALRYRRWVTELGQFSAALEVLQDERFRSDDGVYWSEMATALTGCGRLPEAATAIARAMELDPGQAEWKAFADKLAVVAELRGSDPAPPWPRARQGLDFLLIHQQADLAAKLLAAWLWRAEPLEDDALSEALALMGTLFHHLDVHRSAALLTALERHVAGAPALDAIRTTVAGLIGGTLDTSPAPGGAIQALRDLQYCLALACAGAGGWTAAIERLGGMSLEHKRDLGVRNAMARSVGRLVLERAPLRFRRAGRRRRIFNLLPFDNEGLMLQLRLKTMASWVDHFVIVESSSTFTGQPKPLYFQQMREQFAAYGDKILHVTVEDFPPCISSPWGRDFYQRDMAISAISGLCAEDDLVLLTDADEIVRREPIETFDGEFAGLRMETFRYFLNNRLIAERDEQRGAGAVWKARHLKEHGSSYARFVLSQYDPERWIYDAGWHFTSIYDPHGLERKIKSYAHQEYAHRDRAHFEQVLEQIRNGRMEPGWERIEVDASFPPFIQRARHKLARFIL